MSQALYRKWRSRTFDQVVGQEHVTQTLRNALRSGRVAHAYLFSGPRGTGKTSTARILAKALNCLNNDEAARPCDECGNCIAISEGRLLDLIEIDAASNNGVDDVRELRDKVSFQPSEGRYKVYIIDEVHMLSTQAFNALLKTLEEPPPHARFILATTEPHKIPATVHSRCQRFDFRRIPVPEIAAHLRHIAESEGFSAEESALVAIARSSQGCMRDAVSLLDQMTSYGTETISLEQVQQVLGSVGSGAVVDFVDAIANGATGEGLGQIHRLLLEGVSLQEFTLQVVEHLRGILLLQLTGDSTLLSDQPAEVVARMTEQAGRIESERLLFATKRFSEAIQELKGGIQPQLPLEMALIETVEGAAVQPIREVAPRTAGAAAGQRAPAAPAASGVKGGSAGSAAQESGADTVADGGETVGAEATTEFDGAETVVLDEEAVERLRSRWEDFLSVVKQRCGLKQQAALRSVRDIAIGQNAVAFAFGNNAFTQNLISETETLSKVAGILSQFLGRPVSLSCQKGETAKLAASAGRVVRRSSDGDGSDPLVEFAVSELGAEVVK